MSNEILLEVQPNKIYKIIDHLFITNKKGIEDMDHFNGMIIGLTLNPINQKHINIPINESPLEPDMMVLSKNYEVIFNIIDSFINQSIDTIIYSDTGIQLAPSIAAIYLRMKFKVDSSVAIQFVKMKNPDVFKPQINLAYKNFIHMLNIEQPMTNVISHKQVQPVANIEPTIEDPCAKRRTIWHQTQEICTIGYLSRAIVKSSEKIEYDPNCKPPYKPFDKCGSVVNMDCLDVAKRLRDFGMSPIVLNMADISYAGGSVDTGGYGQEESIFLRSNYFRTLHNRSNLYPISGPEGIYSSNVIIFRDNSYNIITNPYQVSFVAMAAIKEPQLVKGEFTEDDYELTLKKIDTIFQIAFKKKHDSIVLSSFGCGDYRNPMNQMVDIFNICLKKWNGVFKAIYFAILSTNRNGMNTDAFTYFQNNLQFK